MLNIIAGNHLLNRWSTFDNFIDFITSWTITWFLIVLLIFSVIYTIWRQISKIDSIQKRILKDVAIPKLLFGFNRKFLK